MKKIDFLGSFFLLFLILFIFSCKNENKFKLPNDVQIVAKFHCLDEFTSPSLKFCESDNVAFLELDQYDCGFKLDNLEFDILMKCVFNKKGNVETFWRSSSDGLVVDTLKCIGKDTSFMKDRNLCTLHPILDVKNNCIFEQGKTFEIEKVFPLEKIIMVKKDSTMLKGRTRYLYQYF